MDAGRLRLVGAAMAGRPGVQHSHWRDGGKQCPGAQAQAGALRSPRDAH